MIDDIGVSILIPVWDDEESIGGVITDALAGCRRAGLVAECLVYVDPRTRDATAERAREAGAHVVVQQGRGLTAAVLQVATGARADVCAVLNGDGQHDGAMVTRLAGPVTAGETDLCSGVRDLRLIRSGFGRGPRGATRYAGARLFGIAARFATRNPSPTRSPGCSRADGETCSPADTARPRRRQTATSSFSG